MSFCSKRSNKNDQHQLAGHFYLYNLILRLCLFDSTHRASVSASTAVNASVRINLIDITCRDSSNRTFINTSTASGAIFSNFVSHFFNLLVIVLNNGAKIMR